MGHLKSAFYRIDDRVKICNFKFSPVVLKREN
jgi:hypothetical protein